MKSFTSKNLKWVYDALFQAYGAQHWWPAATPFEVMVGAILTQNTAWANVEKAIENLRHFNCLRPQTLLLLKEKKLAQLLKPSGYFNIKATRLRSFCHWYLEQGQFEKLNRLSTSSLRKSLLSVHGIGPETADDILLYAFHRPVFVIDAYTHRLFSRLNLTTGKESYEHLRHRFEQTLDADHELFNEYHALIVLHAKNVCKRTPLCSRCCLKSRCFFFQQD